ncbi:acid protease [Abortiporus biennis]|nr:acid protease [Abortiporus biennis]
MLSISLLTTLLLSLTVSSTPIVVRDSLLRLPITKRINGKNLTSILEHNQTRSQDFRRRSAAANFKSGRLNARKDVRVMNHVVDYVVEVNIGSPPTPYQLLIDTGSSNTWVGAGGQLYIPTSSSVSTGQQVSVAYGSDRFVGTEYIDTVSLGSGLTIVGQSIGVALIAEGFLGVDGILGLGPVGLTADTVTGPNAPRLFLTPNRYYLFLGFVMENLYSQHSIESNLISMSFSPPTAVNPSDGELTFGGIDASKYVGEIHYSNITLTSPASEYWGIDASDVFKTYQQVTGAVLDESTRFLRLTQSQYENLQSLFFNINGIDFELTPNAQIWPRSYNSYIGGDPDKVYLMIKDLGTNLGQGLDFILGTNFLERYYSVFDMENRRVGFAQTARTFSQTN